MEIQKRGYKILHLRTELKFYAFIKAQRTQFMNMPKIYPLPQANIFADSFNSKEKV